MEGQLLNCLSFPFVSFLVFSWCDMNLHLTWMIIGQSGILALHITSRNLKASSFRLHYFRPNIYLNFISLRGMGIHFTILLVIDFT